MSDSRLSRRLRPGDGPTILTITDVQPIILTIPAGSRSGSAILNLWDALARSQYYQNFRGMFDAVHFEHANIVLTGQGQVILSSASSSPTIVTAFDRNGIEPAGAVPPPYEVIGAYENARIRQWSVGATLHTDLYIRAMSSEETDMWLPLSLLRPAVGASDTPDNPCNAYSSTLVPFKPTLLIGATVPLTVPAPQTLHFSCQITFGLVFKDPRKDFVAVPDPVPTPEPTPDPDPPSGVSQIFISKVMVTPHVYDLSAFAVLPVGSVPSPVPPGKYRVIIAQSSSMYYELYVLANRSNSPVELTVGGPYFYVENDIPNAAGYIAANFLNSAGVSVIVFTEDADDTDPTAYSLNTSYFKLDLPPLQ